MTKTSSAHPQPLRHAVLEITNRCNLRCSHCASGSGHRRDRELSTTEWLKVVESVGKLGGEEVTLIGGEVLIHPHWERIARAIVEAGMRLVFITNGLLMNADARATLGDLKPHLVGVSLDSASPAGYRAIRGVDGFDVVKDLLLALRDDGHPNVNAISTFTRHNLHEFDAFADLLDNTGITWQIQIATAGGERFNKESFLTLGDYAWLADRLRNALLERRDSLLIQTMDDFGYFPLDPSFRFLHQIWHGCMAGRDLIGVRSDGGVMPCLSLGNGFVEANLRDEPLEDIWQSGRYFGRFRQSERHLSGGCAVCPHGEDCRGGCTSMALTATGTMGHNPYCLRQTEEEEILGALPHRD